MKAISFPLFEKDGKSFHWTPDWILGLLWIMPLSLAWIFENQLKQHPIFQSLISDYAIPLVIVSIALLIASFFKYKPINGKFSGELIFKSDTIEANGKVYQLNEINKLDFAVNDYYGKRSSNGRSFNPKLSQGVGNFVSFTDKQEQKHVIYFRLKNKREYMLLSFFINEAIEAKKMSIMRATDIIGIGNIPI